MFQNSLVSVFEVIILEYLLYMLTFPRRGLFKQPFKRQPHKIVKHTPTTRRHSCKVVVLLRLQFS